jgi:hypothetical protein
LTSLISPRCRRNGGWETVAGSGGVVAAGVGATNATLVLVGAGVFAAGQYVLVARNAHCSVTSAVVNVFPDFGGLLAYEGFNYGPSSGDIGGARGGFGWAGPWVNVNGATSQSYANSLTAGANALAG